MLTLQVLFLRKVLDILKSPYLFRLSIYLSNNKNCLVLCILTSVKIEKLAVMTSFIGQL